MKQTTNYGFNKPELQDSPPDITVLNPNFDKIDAQLKSLTDKDTELNTAINQVKTDYLPKTGGNVTNALTVKNKTVAVSVNGSVADANGNITIDVGGDVQSVNGVQPDSNGNVVLDLGGDVQSVDGIEPDEEGNVALDASKRSEILEGAKRVTDVEADPEVAKVEALQTSLASVESNVEGLRQTKLDNSTAHIVETWKNGTNWYRKWSDGWIEQGGYVGVGSNVEHIITFPTEFSDTNYYINKNNHWWGDADMQCMYINFYGKTTTSAKVYNSWVSNQGVGFTWYACGF